MGARLEYMVNPAPIDGDRIALISGERSLSQSELAVRSQQAASALHDLGVWQGDRVALLMRNDFAYFEATRGAALLGASTVPLNWHLTAEEISYILDDCSAKVLIGHVDLLTESVLAVCGDVHVIALQVPEEVRVAYGIADGSIPGGVAEWSSWIAGYDAWEKQPRAMTAPMFYTSGTTGRPKGVRRTSVPREIAATGEQRSRDAWGLDQQDIRSVMTGPLYHSAPNAYGMAVVRGGGLLALQPRFDPEGLLALIERHRITHLHMVPTMFVRLLALPETTRHRYDLSSLVHVSHGAAPCPPEVKQQMIQWWGPVIVEYYAMTETGIIAFSTSRDWLAKPGTVGRAASGVEIRILDDSLESVPAGSTGEICVKTALTSYITYHRAADKTEEMRRGDFIATGDIGHLDTDGFLFISDRKSDMVISAGVNIYPAEVEAALVNLPGVKDCAVFGLPDPEYGERLVAILETDRPVAADEFRDFLKPRLAAFKIPREFHIAANLPREDSGKIKKRLLQTQYGSRSQ